MSGILRTFAFRLITEFKARSHTGQAVWVLSQSTLSQEELAGLIAALKSRYGQVEGLGDSCYATTEHRHAVRDLSGRFYETYEELKRDVAEYVEFFNSRRIHQKLGYKTPDQIEEMYVDRRTRAVELGIRSLKERIPTGSNPCRDTLYHSNETGLSKTIVENSILISGRYCSEWLDFSG